MGGICGVISLSTPLGSQVVAFDRCLLALAHGSRKLGHCARLGQVQFGSLPSVGQHHQQPFFSRSNDAMLVVDGRLDNRTELIQQLSVADDLPDGALLLLAYERWQLQMVHHLLGEYTAALWDEHHQRLLIMRDPFGQRPLYFHQQADRLVFASEIKGLLQFPWVPMQLCHGRMVEYLACQSVNLNPQHSFFQDIRRVEAASILHFSHAGTHHSPYWRPDPHRQIHAPSDQAYVEGFRVRYHRAVQRRIPDDAEVGIFLSGGYDSSSVAASAAAHLQKSGRTLHAFISVLPLDYAGPQKDVRLYSEALKRQLPNLELHYVTAQDKPQYGEAELCRICETPVDALITRLYVLMERAHHLGITQILTGYGGDLAATPRASGYLCGLALRGQFASTFKELRARSRVTGVSPWKLFRSEVVKPLLPTWLWHSLVRLRHGQDAWTINAMCTEAFARSSPDFAQLRDNPSEGFRSLRTIRANSCRGLRFSMSGRGYEAIYNLATHFGLSVAHPLLDKELVEYSLALPGQQHVHQGQLRHMVRRAFAEQLPPMILERKESNDFIVPDINMRTRQDFDELNASLARLRTDAAVAAIVNVDKVAGLLAELGPGTQETLSQGTAQLALRGLSAASFIQAIQADTFRHSADQIGSPCASK